MLSAACSKKISIFKANINCINLERISRVPRNLRRGAMEYIFSASTPLILQARQISCNIHGIKSMEASKLFHRIDHFQRHSYHRDNRFISLSSFSRGNLLSCEKNNARILIVEAFTSDIPSPHSDNNIKQNH